MFNEQVSKIIIMSFATGCFVYLVLMAIAFRTSQFTVFGRYIRRALDFFTYVMVSGALMGTGYFLLVIWIEVLK